MKNKMLNLVIIIIQIIGTPLISLILALMLLLILPNNKYPSLIVISIIIIIIIGIFIFQIMGRDYIKIFYRYIKDEETFSDEEKVNKSYTTSVIMLIFFGSLIWGLFLYF